MSVRPDPRIPGSGTPFVATVEQAALAFLCRDAGREYYDREVADAVGLSRGAVNTALRALAAAGLLRVEERGRMKYYRADPNDPRVRSFRSLLTVAGTPRS